MWSLLKANTMEKLSNEQKEELTHGLRSFRVKHSLLRPNLVTVPHDEEKQKKLQNNGQSVALEGQCYCGSVKIKALTMPIHKSICHCVPCRRSSGSMMFVTLFPKDKVLIEGELTEVNPNDAGLINISKTCEPATSPGGQLDLVKNLSIDSSDSNVSANITMPLPCNGAVRKNCAKCNSYIMNDLGENLVDVSGGLWDWGSNGFEPDCHMNYELAIFKMEDDVLPKYKDYPAMFGGTDEIIGDELDC